MRGGINEKILRLLEIQSPSILQRVQTEWLDTLGIRLYMLRDDLLHPVISGNKWRKLSGYLTRYELSAYHGLLSWASPWSHHLHALSYLAQYGIRIKIYIPQTTGLDRIPTAQAARQWGAELIPLSRTAFRQRWTASASPDDASWLRVPEGGSGPEARSGISTMIREMQQQLSWHPDYWLFPVGNGGTAWAAAQCLQAPEKILAAHCVKGGRSREWIDTRQEPGDALITHWEEAHLGGLGKGSEAYWKWLDAWYAETGILLDPLYTGKTLYALYRNRQTLAGCTLATVHTGGLIAWENLKAKNR